MSKFFAFVFDRFPESFGQFDAIAAALLLAQNILLRLDDFCQFFDFVFEVFYGSISLFEVVLSHEEETLVLLHIYFQIG
jgi:hypothetical protein